MVLTLKTSTETQFSEFDQSLESKTCLSFWARMVTDKIRSLETC